MKAGKRIKIILMILAGLLLIIPHVLSPNGKAVLFWKGCTVTGALVLGGMITFDGVCRTLRKEKGKSLRGVLATALGVVILLASVLGMCQVALDAASGLCQDVFTDCYIYVGRTAKGFGYHVLSGKREDGKRFRFRISGSTCQEAEQAGTDKLLITYYENSRCLVEISAVQ